MTKEELEKEAEKALDKRMGTYAYINRMNVQIPYTDGYMDSAEPREKRIAELEEKIEKMKCCSNCKHFNKEEDIEYCWNCERQLVNSLDNMKAEDIIKDEWEIKEK